MKPSKSTRTPTNKTWKLRFISSEEAKDEKHYEKLLLTKRLAYVYKYQTNSDSDLPIGQGVFMFPKRFAPLPGETILLDRPNSTPLMTAFVNAIFGNNHIMATIFVFPSTPPHCICNFLPSGGMGPNPKCQAHGNNPAKPPKRLLKPSKVPQTFPDRVVLGEGYPWVTGLGKPDKPYDSAMILKARIGVKPLPLKFPNELWFKDVPKYRLVFEKVK